LMMVGWMVRFEVVLFGGGMCMEIAEGHYWRKLMSYGLNNGEK
jgi:hypothetical protein